MTTGAAHSSLPNPTYIRPYTDMGGPGLWAFLLPQAGRRCPHIHRRAGSFLR